MKFSELFTSSPAILRFRAKRKLEHLYVHATARDFAYKVRLRMKYDRNRLFITLPDKYAVKAYAHERGVKTAEVYYVTTEPETIPFGELPETYFVKANHGWNWNILHRDGSFYFFNNEPAMSLPKAEALPPKSELSQAQCVQLCKTWLTSVYNPNEWVYQMIEPKIFVEETLEDAYYPEMSDYRFFAFDGVVKVIEFDNDAYRRADKGFFVDRAWREFRISAAETPSQKPPRPENLDELIGVAERLSEGIDFVRVDLYNTTKGVYLGEMTLYPQAGEIRTPTYNPKFNQWLGDQWTLDKRYFSK